MGKNLGYLFYKDYFRKNNKIELLNKNNKIIIDFDAKKNKTILEYELDDKAIAFLEDDDKMAKDYFYLKVNYPGILVGSGLSHGVGNDDEIKIGFYFDYTTGLPAINSSSVKGLLRSAFDYKEYIKGVIDGEENIEKESSDVDIDKLREEIFEGVYYSEEGKKLKPLYERDVFFDAVINIEYNKEKEKVKILSEDYITPHYQSEFKSPTPIKFIKISPGIIVKFRYNLKDGILSSVEKLWLFRRILIDFGIGAKTNLGYGNFDEKYGIDKLINMQKRKKEEEIGKLSELEKLIYFADRDKGTERYDGTVMKLYYNELDRFEGKDRIDLAKYIKNAWVYLNKWEVKKKNKQFEKIVKIKEILGE